MTVMTKADFAREIGRTRQYVNKLVRNGKVVLVKSGGQEMVDVERSKALLAHTADVANDPAAKVNGGRQSVGMKMREGDAAQTDPAMTAKSSEQYTKSRAVKEGYSARLKKVEFEEKMKTVVRKDGVEKAAFAVSRVLREKLKAFPNRLAPKVTVITDQKENFILLTDEVENLIREIQDAINELIQ